MDYAVIKDILHVKQKNTSFKPVPFYQTPNVSRGRNTCELIVVHYTGSHGSAQGDAVNWGTKRESGASWHLGVDRDGSVVQLGDFRKILWHAGKSFWQIPVAGSNIHYDIYNGVNPCSIGIEFCNSGLLEYNRGKYYNRFGKELPKSKVFEDNDGGFWERFDSAQLEEGVKIIQALCDAYNIKEIVGHNEVSPGRKVDPGPAFPLADVRAACKRPLVGKGK